MQNSIDEEFMSLAIKQAEEAKRQGDLPFGSVVVQEGRVVGQGRAKNNTSGDVTDHAELIAVREACRNLGTNKLKGCTIYCTNEPCLMCAAGIFQADIAQVVIAVSRDDLPRLLRSRKLRIDNLAEDSGYEISITKGVLKEQVLQLFKGIQKD